MIDMEAFTSIEIDAYRAEIAAKQKEHAVLTARIAGNHLEMQKMGAEMRRIQNEADIQIKALQELRRQLEVANWDLKKAARLLADEIKALEQRLSLALQALQDSQRFKLAAVEFDKLTVGAPWREWAKDYQVDGAKIMSTNHRTINADKMGLGKSIQSLMACDMVQSERVIIMGPNSLVNNWVRELKKWAPKRVPIRLDKMTKVERYASLELVRQIGGPVCVVINFEAWRKDNELINQLIGLKFDTAIIDEFQFVKNPKTNAARGVQRIVLANNVCPICQGNTWEERKGIFYWTRCSECSWNVRENNAARWDEADRRSIKSVFPLSGTPILNRPDELFVALNLIRPDIFYDVEIFRNMFCIMVEGKWRWGPGGMDRLEKHLSGHFISRTKKDVGLNLPPQVPTIMELDFEPELYVDQQRIIDMVREQAQIALNNGKHVSINEQITILLRLRQANVCPAGMEFWQKFYDDPDRPNHVTHKELILRVADEVNESIKLDAAFDLITDVTEDGLKSHGERVVVFSQFKAPLHILAERLNTAGIDAIVMDGDTSAETRRDIELDFDRTSCSETDYAHQVLLTSFKVGGTGLNLTAATQIVILDEPWNPGTLEQALQRVDRIGQTQASTVTIIRINNTVDEWLAELLEEKADLVNAFEERGTLVTQSLLQALEDGKL